MNDENPKESRTTRDPGYETMEDCIFCKIAKGDAKSWKVYENENVYAFLDIHPVNAYHTLIIPKKHYKNIFDIPIEELKNVMEVVKN